MIIGVPKEIKPQEARVGVTPAGASVLINSGHEVFIQNGAGVLSGFNDSLYKGLNIINRKVVHEEVARAFDLKYINPSNFLN
jgi:alanine dehydrogenase